jgi:hypothetical protein
MHRLLGVLLAVLLPLAAQAQTSTLIGTVLDAESRVPVTDAIVTATSPSLGRALTTVTDAQGRYRMTGLPPGLYTLRFEKEQYDPYARADIPVRLNRTVRVNVELLPADIEYVIEYVGGCSASLFEFTDSTTGEEVMYPQGTSLASNPPSQGAVRTADGLAVWVPGVTEGLEGFSVHGATPYENAYRLDGLSTRDPASGLNALPVSQDFVSSTSVLTGGLMPEHGRATGGLLQVNTRDILEELTGSVFAHWAPGLLEGRRESVEEGDALGNLGDFGATLAARPGKGRLRFFVGVTPALGRVEHTGPSGTAFQDSRGLQALGKVTYQTSPLAEVSLSVLTAPQSLRAEGATLDRDTTRVALGYARESRDGNLSFSVRAGWLGQRDAWEFPAGLPTDEDGVLRERSLDQYQARAAVLWLLRKGDWGSHHLGAGVDVEHFVHARTRAWAEDTGGPGTLESRTPGTVLGGYVQDSWLFANRVTVHGGLRYDVQLLETGEAGSPRVTVPLLSPRLGVILDPWADTMAKLFVQYARYAGPVPVGLLDRATGTERVPMTGPSVIDPELEPLASHELVAGAGYTLDYKTQVTATYTHRALDSGLASLRTGSRGSVVLVNPGSGLGSALPKAERTYDAVTLAFFRDFNDGSYAHVSYTGSRLRGNQAGPWDASTGDRPHVFRAWWQQEFRLSQRFSFGSGLSYVGGSGTPVAEGTSRTPWLHTVDARLMLHWWLGKLEIASFSLDAFNLFNFQAATRLEARDSGLVPVRYQPPRQLRLGVRYRF